MDAVRLFFLVEKLANLKRNFRGKQGKLFQSEKLSSWSDHRPGEKNFESCPPSTWNSLLILLICRIPAANSFPLRTWTFFLQTTILKEETDAALC